MTRVVPISAVTDDAQLEEIIRRKDRFADDMRENVHEAWALSWLAMQCHDGNRSDHTNEKHREATYVALSYVVSLLEEAKAHHNTLTGVHRAVLDDLERAP